MGADARSYVRAKIRPTRLFVLVGLAVLALILAGCGSPASDGPVPSDAATAPEAPVAEPTPALPTASPTNAPKPTRTKARPTAAKEPTLKPAMAQPTPEPTATQEPPAKPSGDSSGAVAVEIAEGSQARYLVGEQLARLPLPNDAVGETSEVSGSLAFDADGGVIAEESQIVVNLASLVSDSSRRDGYVRDRSLQTDRYPDATFAVKETPGLPWPLPAQGEASFQIVGDMMVHGVTKPLTWEATARFEPGEVAGQAKTSFTFQDFEIPIPQVRVVLSVEETIRLELDFTATVR